MNDWRNSFIVIFLCLSFCAFSQRPSLQQQDVQLLADNVFHLSEVMLHDVAAPVAASRFYAYSLLGAYEATHFGTGRLTDINEKINVNPEIKSPPIPKDFNISFTANYTNLQVGRYIMTSGHLLKEKQKDLVIYFKKKKKLSESTIKEHIAY